MPLRLDPSRQRPSEHVPAPSEQTGTDTSMSQGRSRPAAFSYPEKAEGVSDYDCVTLGHAFPGF